MKKVITLLCSCILAASCSNQKQPVLDYKSQYAPARIRTISESEFRKLIENGCEIRTLKNGVTTPVAFCDGDSIQIFYTNLYEVHLNTKNESSVEIIYGYAKMDKAQFMKLITSYGFKNISQNALFSILNYNGKQKPFNQYPNYYKRIYNSYYHGEFPADVKQMLHKIQHGTSQEQYMNSWYLQNDGFYIFAADRYEGNDVYSWYQDNYKVQLVGKIYPYLFLISTNENFSDNFVAKIKLKDPEKFWNTQCGYSMDRHGSEKDRSWRPPYDKFYTQRQIDELNRTRR